MAALLALPAVRAWVWLSHTGSLQVHDPNLFYSSIYSQWHWDGLLIGLLIAHQWSRRKHPHLSARQALLLITLGCVAFITLHQLQHEIFTFSGVALLFGSVTWAGLATRTTLLSSRVFYWISRLSFGMYLNHHYLIPLVLRRLLSQVNTSGLLTQTLGTIATTLLSATLAVVTFCLIEHPALNLRVHLLEPASAGPRSVQRDSSRSTAA